jgi:DHA1 family L-arabinose/isopropyl-beta-D-thiogalactopyranoside export protein-like MFS transporter/DHA1 family inner membrane transport protein
MVNARSAPVSHRRASAALVALSIGTFSFVTIEVLPIGLLTVIADDLARSRSSIGLLVTGYAAVVVLASLPLTRLTTRVPRRLVLGGTLAGYVLSTLVAAFAGTYAVLLGARLVTALSQALFWSIVAPAATALFAPEVRGRMIARLAIGTSLAPVLGVPAGTWLGQHAGWRTAFLAMAGVGVLTFLAVVVLVPTVPPAESPTAFGSDPDRRRYWVLVAVTAIGVAGAMTTLTYIAPFLLDVAGFPAGALGPLLLVSGAAGVVGTLTVGRVLDRRPWLSLVAPLALLSAAALGLWLAGAVQPVTIVMLAAFGMAFNAFAAAAQNRTMQVAPGRTDTASAIVSSAFNVGIATGSLLGGLLIATVGVRSIGLAGGALLLAALGLMLAEGRLPSGRARRPAPRAAAPANEARPGRVRTPRSGRRGRRVDRADAFDAVRAG